MRNSLKTFDEIKDKVMILQDKLFSENSGETLYSVLMSESEVALFSEFQKEFAKSWRTIIKETNDVAKESSKHVPKRIKEEDPALARLLKLSKKQKEQYEKDLAEFFGINK